MTQITHATLDQAPLVHQIMLEAFEEFRGVLDPPSGAHIETVEKVLKIMAEGGALLAWEGEQAVGSLRYLYQSDHLYVGRVSVLPAYRGRGIAGEMMRAVEPIARDQGYAEIHLSVRMVLQSNLIFYERLGYETLNTHLHEKGNAMVVNMGKRLD